MTFWIYIKNCQLRFTIKNKMLLKERWLKNFNKDLEDKFTRDFKNEIGDFRLDNLKTETGEDNFGLFQESYNPIGLHVDAGFNSKEVIYKQTLVPLTSIEVRLYLKISFMEIQQILQWMKTS